MSNDRGLKTRKPVSSTIDIKLWERFEELSIETRIPKSKLMDEAIEDLLKKHESLTK